MKKLFVDDAVSRKIAYKFENTWDQSFIDLRHYTLRRVSVIRKAQFSPRVWIFL